MSVNNMAIALNLLEFHPGEMGGVETYVRELVTGLVQPDSGCDLTILCSERGSEYFSRLSPDCSQMVFTSRRGSFGRFTRSLLRAIGIDLVKIAVDRRNFTLIHTPFTNVRSYHFKSPQIITFLDLQHEYFPDFFSHRELRRRRAKFQGAVNAATRIIAISAFTKQCLTDHYKLGSDFIDVVHLASNLLYTPLIGLDEAATIRSKYGLNHPFLYYPAATWPHKNHAALLSALNILVRRYNFSGELVLTGIASNHHDEVKKTIRDLGLTERVRILGYLPYEDLPCLYNLARLLVFPSLHEGFGIPLVEAMASGCPVVCAQGTSIPEVVGDAASMFDPTDPEKIAETIWDVWNDDDRLNSMRVKGLQRAQSFSWQLTVKGTIDVYRRVSDHAE